MAKKRSDKSDAIVRSFFLSFCGYFQARFGYLIWGHKLASSDREVKSLYLKNRTKSAKKWIWSLKDKLLTEINLVDKKILAKTIKEIQPIK